MTLNQLETDEAESSTTIYEAKLRLTLVRWCAVSVAFLMACTLRLWFPPLAGADFPSVPLWKLLCSLPPTLDWGLSALLLLGWVALSCRRHWGSVLIVSAGIGLILLNQHRLQPWHYQLTLFAGVFAFAPAREQVIWLRRLVISVYAYSAISKADYEFLHTVGPQFLQASASLSGLKLPTSQNSLAVLAAGFPLVEFLIAAGLCGTSTRRWAGIGACLFHVGLLVILGPLGLNHSLGVVGWNIHFLVLAWLLFVSSNPEKNAVRIAVKSHSPSWIWCLMLPVFVLPLFERFGYWDHWPSWAVYAPHTSRVETYVAVSATDRLPSSLQSLLPESELGTLWVRIPAEQWSLNSLGVPIYPQARFQLGIANHLAQILDSQFEIRADVLGAASRWNGKRSEIRLEGLGQIQRAENLFWCNSLSR